MINININIIVTINIIITININIIGSSPLFPKLSLYMPVGEHLHKNPVSASAMLTGKFLQIRKLFATS